MPSLTCAPTAAATAKVETHCPYCALQCGMTLTAISSQNGNGPQVSVSPRNFPTNRGGLCQKGWTSASLLNHPDRLQAPLMRTDRNSSLQPCSWDEAYDRITSAVRALQSAHGRDSIGVFGGGSLTNEKAYQLGKFARVALGTSQIDYNGRFCMSSAAAASTKAFGIDRGLPFPLADIPHAETILLIGGNPAETMPPIMQYFQEQVANGGSFIVVDPRRTATAQAATLHLQITPGTDAALANGLLHIAIKERLIDLAFIESRTSGFERVEHVVSSYWPERVERITGIPEAQLFKAARLLGNASSAMVLTARGPEQQSSGVNNVLAFINLLLALGKAGQPYSGYGCLTGQGNGQGGREHGQKADQLPGYRKIDNLADRAYISSIWGVPEQSLPGPGLSAYEMLDRMGRPGAIRALLVFGSNLVVSAPNAGHIQERLAGLDLLVVSDFFLSETAAMADVVLPTVQWAEEEGTMTNLEGRVLLRCRLLHPPANTRTDLQILSELAKRLEAPSEFPATNAAVFDELRRASSGGKADYSGVSYTRIADEDGVFWPCPGLAHSGTPRLFADRFATPDGLARFHPVDFRAAVEQTDARYPLYLTTGRIMQHYQSGTQTRRVDELMKTAGRSFVQIHPAMAQTLGIIDNDPVAVITRRGTATAFAQLTSTIRMDTIFMPFHYNGDGRANLLTNPMLDPVSRMPDFKVCAARIERKKL